MTKFKLEDNLADGLFGFHDPREEQAPFYHNQNVDSPFDAVSAWTVENLNTSNSDPFGQSAQSHAAAAVAAAAKAKKGTPTPQVSKKNQSTPSDPDHSANIGVKKAKKPRRRKASFDQWI